MDGRIDVYKSDEQKRVRGHRLTLEQLSGDVGEKLRQHIETSGSEDGHVAIEGRYYVWFTARPTDSQHLQA